MFDKVRFEFISNPKKMNACDGWFNVADLISCCNSGHYLVVLHNIQVFYCGCCSCVVAFQLLLPQWCANHGVVALMCATDHGIVTLNLVLLFYRCYFPNGVVNIMLLLSWLWCWLMVLHHILKVLMLLGRCKLGWFKSDKASSNPKSLYKWKN